MLVGQVGRRLGRKVVGILGSCRKQWIRLEAGSRRKYLLELDQTFAGDLQLRDRERLS